MTGREHKYHFLKRCRSGKNGLIPQILHYKHDYRDLWEQLSKPYTPPKREYIVFCDETMMGMYDNLLKQSHGEEVTVTLKKENYYQ